MAATGITFSVSFYEMLAGMAYNYVLDMGDGVSTGACAALGASQSGQGNSIRLTTLDGNDLSASYATTGVKQVVIRLYNGSTGSTLCAPGSTPFAGAVPVAVGSTIITVRAVGRAWTAAGLP